ncbi:unnamed protein product, partial [Ectocarpus fasciculatus]
QDDGNNQAPPNDELSQERPGCWHPMTGEVRAAMSATDALPKTRPPGTSAYRWPPRGDVGGVPAATGDRSSSERSGVRRVAGEE